MRTTGSVEPYTVLNVKAAIDAGRLAGPHMDVTGPYLEGPDSPFIQMHPLRDADDARATVAFWAAQGATSFKAYMHITRAELKAAIDEAHAHGLKLTGHLCSVTYPEAAALGIDDLEHGFWVNTQNDPGKTPDVCPRTVGAPTLTGMTPGTPAARDLIATLVKAHVAVTSTLLDAAGVRARLARLSRAAAGRARYADARGARRLSAAACARRRRARGSQGSQGEAVGERAGDGARLREGGRAAARRARSDRGRQRAARLRRCPRDRAAGGRGLHPARRGPYRHAERRDLSRAGGRDRADRGRQAGGHGGRRGRSVAPDRGCRARRDGVQGRRRLRQRQAARHRQGPLRPLLKQRGEADGREAARIDADVELARHRLELPMAVAVEVDRALVLPAPRSERVVAQHQRAPVHLDLGIVGHARPACRGARAVRIVVAADQMLAAVQPGEKPRHLVSPPRDIAQMPHLVVGADRVVPCLDQRRIHGGGVREGAPVDVDRAVIAEMRVGGEQHGHRAGGPRAEPSAGNGGVSRAPPAACRAPPQADRRARTPRACR
ncbi:hypothetical protein SLE2022_405900 [Rubroshorea leprosula]